MTEFIKNRDWSVFLNMKASLKNSLLIISALFLFGCTEKEKEVTEEDNAQLFDVVYQAVGTRENKSYAGCVVNGAYYTGWCPVQGILQTKLARSSSSEGTFIFYYSGYKEPQFVYNLCTGGFKGNYALLDSKGNEVDSDVNAPYNPMDPYGNGNTDTSSATTSTDLSTAETPALIVSYNLKLSITERSLTEGCRPEANRTIAVYRFKSGEVIMVNEYRQILFKPLLVNGSIVGE